ncbi:MAG: hypothetical protein D6743_12195 [Calditrichaeota bacterium]|nr:MAG: hypothetical protein D6743_12195 [Calditrichota bacterium]
MATIRPLDFPSVSAQDLKRLKGVPSAATLRGPSGVKSREVPKQEPVARKQASEKVVKNVAERQPPKMLHLYHPLKKKVETSVPQLGQIVDVKV